MPKPLVLSPPQLTPILLLTLYTCTSAPILTTSPITYSPAARGATLPNLPNSALAATALIHDLVLIPAVPMRYYEPFTTAVHLVNGQSFVSQIKKLYILK